MEVFVIFLLNELMEQKMNLIYQHEHKFKLDFFSNNNLKFNLEPKS